MESTAAQLVSIVTQHLPGNYHLKQSRIVFSHAFFQYSGGAGTTRHCWVIGLRAPLTDSESSISSQEHNIL
jgi:hypothetical protein